MRTVELHVTDEFVNDVGGLPNRHVNEAVGQLAMWAIKGERHGAEGNKVSIYSERNGCLEAVYRDKDGKATYSIFAQRGEDGTYSFHS